MITCACSILGFALGAAQVAPAAPSAVPSPPVAPAPPAAPAPSIAPAAPVAPAPAAAAASARRSKPRSKLTWDLNLDGALGGRLYSPTRLSGFGRIRGGLLYIDERDVGSPSLYSAGIFYEASELSPAAFGVQLEALSLSYGLWAQIGASVDVQPRPGLMASLGWSIFGVESQARWDRDLPQRELVWAFYGKIRVPIRIIIYAVTGN